jgi:hypothetical protein
VYLQVNAEVGWTTDSSGEPLRGLYAKQAISKGGVIASIPIRNIIFTQVGVRVSSLL